MNTWNTILRVGLVSLLVLGTAVMPSPADEPKEKVTTTNFVVTAPNRRMARLIADEAERQRKLLAVRWLGKELPAWSKPCPIEIKITTSGSGGTTTFAFDDGEVLSREMSLEGSLEHILTCDLPHEITHTVLADHFRQPVPSWADEGAAVLAEDAEAQLRYQKLLRDILNTPNRAIPLQQLLAMKDFPRDVMVTYAEGYSITRLLVDRKDTRTFLAFVKQGKTSGDWDKALKENYDLADVQELEKLWMAHLQRLAVSLSLAHAQVEKDHLLLNLSTEKPIDGEKESEPWRVDLKEVQAWNAKGEPIETAVLRTRLQQRSPVLVAKQGSKIDPALLRQVKEDALILCLPLPSQQSAPVPRREEPPLANPTAPMPAAPMPADPVEVRNQHAGLRKHYDLAESYRLQAVKDSQYIQSLKQQYEEAVAQNRPGRQQLRLSSNEARARHDDNLKKAEAEYHWVQDNLKRVPADQRDLTKVEQDTVPFLRADCLFFMSKFSEAQEVYEDQVQFYNKQIKDIEEKNTADWLGWTSWNANRRRLDAKGGVLRCLAVQGRKDEVTQVVAEIRALLEGMNPKVRAEWETWLKVASSSWTQP